MDENAISANSLEKHYHINGKNLSQQYKNHLSDFSTWEQREHAEEWILYEENISENLCLDEVSLSDGELYTVLTNADNKTQKHSLISMVKGTKSEDIIEIFKKIDEEKRKKVKNISLDMANNMEKVANICFSDANLITDRFHVAKLITEAVQTIRIKNRWKAIEEDNNLAKQAKEKNTKYIPFTYQNGDTDKQLLARSRYLLFKSKEKWTQRQKQRAEILFEKYPQIQHAYNLAFCFRNIYQTAKTKKEAKGRIQDWILRVKNENITEFCTAANSIELRLDTILNYFPDKRTNALAENFNSKIKAFRATFRGVRDISFFLFRVANIFA